MEENGSWRGYGNISKCYFNRIKEHAKEENKESNISSDLIRQAQEYLKENQLILYFYSSSLEDSEQKKLKELHESGNKNIIFLTIQKSDLHL